jgi:hypothetical protein
MATNSAPFATRTGQQSSRIGLATPISCRQPVIILIIVGVMDHKFDRRVLPITSAIAAALLATGCSRSPDTANSDVRVCRDNMGRRVDDGNCRTYHGGGGGWYYLNRGSAVARVGQPLNGGSIIPTPGRSYGQASSATITRGGLGMSGRSGLS